MVGIRVFSVLVAAWMLFSIDAYALLPSSKEDVDLSIQKEGISAAPEEGMEGIRREKEILIKGILPMREKRKSTLRPFVSDIIPAPADIERKRPINRTVKGFSPTKAVTAGPVREGLTSRLLANLIFFSVIAAAFLASYFFIRPKSK